jgi:hypothetical protein
MNPPSSALLLIALFVILAGLRAAVAQPTFTDPAQPADASASLGARVTFSCLTHSQNPPVSYQWWFEDAIVTNLGTARTLTLANLQSSQSGRYFVVASDATGSVTSRVARLEVDPTFTKVLGRPPVQDADVEALNAKWSDLNGDGYLDLLVAGGMFNVGWGGGYPLVVYTNQGNARFKQNTSAALLTSRFYGTINAIDFDNDGDADLWGGVSGSTYSVLLTNRGASGFQAITVKSNLIVNGVDVRGPYQAWSDFDHDGYLDVVTGDELRLHVLRNTRDGRFTALTEAIPGVSDGAWAAPLAWVDIDGDGDDDLILIGVSPMALLNQGGRLLPAPRDWFARISVIPWGAAWADYDNDGDMDFYAPGGQVFQNDGTGTFRPAAAAGLGPVTSGEGSRAAWGDFDNDGYLDLYVTTGTYGQLRRNHLFRQDGQGGFVEVLTGSPVHDAADSWTSTWADVDNDGDLDLFVVNSSNAGLAYSDAFYLNNGNANHWLEVWLLGGAPTPGLSNRDAIGAKVRARATIGGRTFWQLRTLSAGNLQGERVAHFGLGDAPRVEVLRVEWPSGIVQEFQDVNPGQILSLAEPAWVPTTTAEVVSPTRYEVIRDQPVTLQAPVTGPGLGHQWQLEGQDIPGATQATLEIPAFGNTNIGKYTVALTGVPTDMAASLAGSTRPVWLAMKHLPVLDGPRISSTTTVSAGARVEIAIDVTGTADPVFQWQHNGIDIPATQNPSATHALLVLDPVETSHAGTYQVVVRGAEDVVVSGVVPLFVDATFTKIRTGAIVAEALPDRSAIWFDYDSDGLPDLFIPTNFDDRSANLLFHNEGNGTFQRILDTPFVRSPTGVSLSGAPADFNNDGRQDLFIATDRGGRNALYRADPAAAWVAVTKSMLPLRNTGCLDGIWADYDRDGYLDLLVSGWSSDSPGLALYRNQGDGGFATVTSAQVGELLSGNLHYTWGPWVDLDLDGDPDLLLNVNWSGFQIFKNDGTGRFSRAEGGSLTGFGGYGYMRCADFDNDGYPDVFTGQFDTPAGLHRNLAGNGFVNVAATAGVVGHHYTGAWGDYDNDGHLDLFAVNYDGPSALYRNQGDGTFTRVDVGSPLTDGSLRIGAYWVDYDRDGFLDLHLACGDGASRPDQLYRNNRNANHWLQVRLVGTTSNRDAIGAKVRVQATLGGRTVWQIRELAGNSSFSDGQPRVAHFGLGTATQATVVRVEWPSGMVQELEGVTADQFLTLTEPLPLGITSSQASGTLRIDCLGAPSTRYHLESSTDFREWHRLDSWTTDDRGKSTIHIVPGPVTMRFYRSVRE